MPVLNRQNREERFRKLPGYTITEMLVVIFITGILASISVPSLINWKHLQTIKTRQLALQVNLEKIKSDAKRWGATCTINGGDLKSSCSSAVLQKKLGDTFNLQSTQEVVINPTVKNRAEEKQVCAEGEAVSDEEKEREEEKEITDAQKEEDYCCRQ